MSTKTKLHELVDACNDEHLLASAIALLSTQADTEWWSTLPLAEQAKTKTALAQLDEGQAVPHDEVLQAAWQKVQS